MQFNSFAFLLFFPAVLLGYFAVPRRARYLWLLAASYYFYMYWDARYALLLAASTLVTYLGGLALAALRSDARPIRAKLVLTAVLVVNLAMLVYYKYANLLLYTLWRALSLASVPARLTVLDIVLPVGISFFVFQAIGYTIDVYRGTLPPERNLLRYALFVSFFPQLVAGPIERASNLLPQLQRLESLELWDPDRILRGFLTMLYGFLLKMVIADRAAIAVDAVFSSMESWPPAAYAAAILLFTVQIYCDFGGYSCIAIGCAQVMGIRLMENFRAPYLARSIRDFWSRWHISLSTWFMDYLYIPLGGNRKGRMRKYLNLLIVFAVSGLWHGAAWHFVFWGLCHALLRVTGEVSLPLRKRLRARLGIREESRALIACQTLITFALVSLAWLFFRAENLSQAVEMLRAMLCGPWRIAALTEGDTVLGLTRPELRLLIIAICLLFCGDCLREKRVPAAGWLMRQGWALRAGVFLLGILALLVFGVYGPGYDASGFIYFQF